MAAGPDKSVASIDRTGYATVGHSGAALLLAEPSMAQCGMWHPLN
jgi:hypothetical protein